MRLTRVYRRRAAASRHARVTLEGNAASHITRVLRLRVGGALALFDGRAGSTPRSIDKAHGGSVTVAVGARERHRARIAAAAHARARRLARRAHGLVVQKATELGVSRLVPVLTERSVVRLSAQHAERKVHHWRAIAVAACEQCGRNRLPQLAAPAALSEFLEALTRRRRHTRLLLLCPPARATLEELPRPAAGVTRADRPRRRA